MRVVFLSFRAKSRNPVAKLTGAFAGSFDFPLYVRDPLRMTAVLITSQIEPAAHRLRKYLNARPLIRGWTGNVEFDHPSALCKRLAKGQLDVALVSSFEFLRNPIYRIVDDVSISSDGPVYSVVVAHRGEFSNIEENRT